MDGSSGTPVSRYQIITTSPVYLKKNPIIPVINSLVEIYHNPSQDINT